MQAKGAGLEGDMQGAATPQQLTAVLAKVISASCAAGLLHKSTLA
jgi:hypothetical protein